MREKPRLIDYQAMNEAVEQSMKRLSQRFFICKDYAVLCDHPSFFRPLIQQKPPFIVEDIRVGIVQKGEMRSVINLKERHLTRGSLMLIMPGTIVHPIFISDDLDVKGIALFTDRPLTRAGTQLPPALKGHLRDIELRLDADTLQLLNTLFETTWQLVVNDHDNLPVIGCQIATILQYVDHLYRKNECARQSQTTRKEQLLEQFVNSVSDAKGRERSLAHFANQLCVSQRYLGTVVHETSGNTAKEWIDRACITEAKVLLKHSSLSINQIADHLQFANPSFFCKYFKRLTGTTPGNYRES